MRIKLNFLVVSLLGLAVSFYAVKAQTSDCTIDVQPIVAKLISAQTAAASGNQTDALQEIADAKAELEVIEANCAREVPNSISLKTTFNAPDDSFSFNYPEGWLAGEFTPTLELFGKGGRTLIGNNEQALAALAKNVDETTFNPTEQAAIVIVGSANTVLYSLGLYDSTNVPKGIDDVKALTEYIQLAINDGPVFDTIGDPIYDGQSAQFTFEDKAFKGIVIITQLSTEKYSLTMLVGGKDTSATLATLATAISNSIQ